MKYTKLRMTFFVVYKLTYIWV